MANEYEKTGFGKRLARYRKAIVDSDGEQKFPTAQKLADYIQQVIPDATVTRGTIVNLELGRKKDATIGELVQLASALGIPPMFLVIDAQNPFGAWEGVTAKPRTNEELFDWFTSVPREHELRERDLENRSLPSDRGFDILKRASDLKFSWRWLTRFMPARYAKQIRDSKVDISLLRGEFSGDFDDWYGKYRADLRLLEIWSVPVPEEYLDVPSEEESWSLALELAKQE